MWATTDSQLQTRGGAFASCRERFLDARTHCGHTCMQMKRNHKISESGVHEQGTDSMSSCMMVPTARQPLTNDCIIALATTSTVPCNSQDSPSAWHSLMLKMYWYEVSKSMVTFCKELTETPLLLPQLTSPDILLQHSSAPAPTHSLW